MWATHTLAGVIFVILTVSGCAVTGAPKPAEDVFNDTAISLAIKSRHAESIDAPINTISVETLYGVVLLTGVAEKPIDKMKAEEIARQVKGVKAVHNEIVVEQEEVIHH